MTFSFSKDFKIIDWKATIQYNVIRSLIAGIVAMVLFFLIDFNRYDKFFENQFTLIFVPFLWALLFVMFVPFVIVPLAKMSQITDFAPINFVANIFCWGFSIMFMLGDPILFVIKNIRPDLIPIKDQNFINFTYMIWIVDPDKPSTPLRFRDIIQIPRDFIIGLKNLLSSGKNQYDQYQSRKNGVSSTKNHSIIRNIDSEPIVNPSSIDSIFQSSDFYSKGLKHYKQAEYHLAKESFETALMCTSKKTPNLDKYWNALGMNYYKLENFVDSKICFNEAMKINPDVPNYYKNLQLAIKKDNTSDTLSITDPEIHSFVNTIITINEYEENFDDNNLTLEVDPKYARAYYYLGRSFEKINNMQKAIEAYGKAVEIDPEHIESWKSKGIALKNQQRYEEALKIYNEAIKFNPSELDLWENKGQILNELGRYSESTALYYRAIEIDSNYPRFRLSLIQTLVSHNRYYKALKESEAALEMMNPDYNEIWYKCKGSALQNLGEPEEAIEAYNQAIEIDPTYDEAWNGKGECLFDLGRYEEAIEAYNQAIEIDPIYASAWYGKGLCLWKMERFEEANETFDQVIQIVPLADAWEKKAVVLVELEKYDDAIEALDNALQIDSSNALMWNYRGLILCEDGAIEEGLKSFEQALDINPMYADAWNSKGLVLSDLGKLELSLDSFEQALKIDPNLSDAWYNMANTLGHLQKFEEALYAYDKVLEIDPKNVNAQELRDLLYQDLNA